MGQSVTTQGVVVADFQGTANQNGFYIEDISGDGNVLTSDGIFVFGVSTPNVAVGDVVRVTGSVQEFNTLTENRHRYADAELRHCGRACATLVSLPEATNGDLERYEGMLVSSSRR